LDEIVCILYMLGCLNYACNSPAWIMYDKSDVMWIMHGQNKYQIPLLLPLVPKKNKQSSIKYQWQSFFVFSLFYQLPFPIKIYTTHTFSRTANPSSLSVCSALYAALCSLLSHNFLLYQTLCSLCSTAFTQQFIWWPYVVPPQVDNLS
jgi:hypothetical protein